MTDRRLRIGMVFYHHPSFRGYAIPHVESEIAERLARRGHEVVAYCPSLTEGRLPDWQGIQVVGVRCRTVEGPRWVIGLELPMRVAARLRPDLDCVVLNGEPGAFVPFLVGRRHRTRAVFAIHGLVRGVIGFRKASRRSLRHRDWWLRHLLGAGETLSARTADLCIAGGHRLAGEVEMLLGVVPRRVVGIPNGVAPRPMRTAEARRAAREALRLTEGILYVAFVGADHRRKGLAVARRAVERAHALDVPVVLLNVGNLSPPIPGEVGYGWVDEATKWRILEAADAFILPTQYEASSLAVREAASVGLPILTTPQAGVDDGVSGRDYLLFEPADVEGFASGLVRLFRDPEWGAELGARGHARIASWTFEEQTAAWETALRRLVLGELPRPPHGPPGA
jgi:glycosyltransferase involved in cell wall biosynthesis